MTDEQKVWEKGKIVPGKDQNTWRKDDYGSLINRDHHGDRSSEYGWEVDHITPDSCGGTDDLKNLRPLHWKNNISRQNC